jgi:hypothetical protein
LGRRPHNVIVSRDDLLRLLVSKEIAVLNRYFIRPTTVDRIHASWIGDAIERYVVWLTEQKYAPLARMMEHQPARLWRG